MEIQKASFAARLSCYEVTLPLSEPKTDTLTGGDALLRENERKKREITANVLCNATKHRFVRRRLTNACLVGSIPSNESIFSKLKITACVRLF